MKFSVLLPTRNRLKYLKYAVTSVLQQDYTDWEIIISDNDSEDDIAGYVQSLEDERIKYFRTSSFCPVTENWNNALEKSSGDYVIMLGDDDCLLKNYFSTCYKLIQQHSFPDLIYNSAVQFTYPNVIPGVVNGSVIKPTYASFLVGAKDPYILDKQEVFRLAKKTLNFNLVVNFNAQHSLISRELINRMKECGPFYQSPYPDYYSTSAMLIKAQRILAVPTPLVAIGVCPKSFGCFYHNDQESLGNDFLKNNPDREIYDKVKKHLLFGTNMNTSWLYAMETVKQNYNKDFNLNVNYKKYRMLQVFQNCRKIACFEKIKKSELLNVAMNLNWWEKFAYVFPFLIAIMLRFHPNKSRAKALAFKWSYMYSHPSFEPPIIFPGQYDNILDVFDKINPDSALI